MIRLQAEAKTREAEAKAQAEADARQKADSKLLKEFQAKELAQLKKLEHEYEEARQKAMLEKAQKEADAKAQAAAKAQAEAEAAAKAQAEVAPAAVPQAEVAPAAVPQAVAEPEKACKAEAVAKPKSQMKLRLRKSEAEAKKASKEAKPQIPAAATTTWKNHVFCLVLLLTVGATFWMARHPVNDQMPTIQTQQMVAQNAPQSASAVPMPSTMDINTTIQDAVAEAIDLPASDWRRAPSAWRCASCSTT